MTINENLTEFAGKPVEDWLPDAKSVDPATTHYRIRLEYDDFEGDQKWVDRLSSYLSQPKAEQTTGLVVGMWGADYEDGTNNADQVIEAIAAARNKLPNLKVLFLGDITYEESEISWIKQGRISPLFDAYPDLETLVVRGGDELKVGAVRHHKLKRFIIQSGGLDREIVQDAIMADFPELEHFELWLGSRNYGGNTTPEDFAPLLSGERFPKLTYLGLCDSEFTDDLAGVLANAPVLRQLRTLDISLGVLSDVGAAALHKSPLISQLQKLDIHHHYCSDEMVAQLKQLPIEVDASGQQREERWGRSIAVSE